MQSVMEMQEKMPLLLAKLGFSLVVDAGSQVVHRWPIGRGMHIDAQGLTDGANDGCWLVRLQVAGHPSASISTDYEPIGVEDPGHSMRARIWYVLDHGRRELLKVYGVENNLRVAVITMALQRLDAARSAA